MNRTRYNHLRSDREIKGLQQVSQMPQPTNPLSPLRKTTFTRAELMQSGQLSMASNRPKRLPTLNTGKGEKMTAEVAANRRTGTVARTHFLPRVAKLASNNYNSNNNNSTYNNNNNVLDNAGKPQNRDKSKLKCGNYVPSDSSSLNSRRQNLPLPQQQQQQQQQQLPLLSSASSSMSNSSNDLRKIKLAKAFRLPDDQNKSFVYLCKPVKKVKELLMVRSLHNSNDNFFPDVQQITDNDFFGKLSVENELKLMSKDTDSDSYCSSLNLPEELELENFEVMLETQLQDVRQREQHLQQLAAQVQSEQSSENERDRDKYRDRHRSAKEQEEKHVHRSFEMDYVFQNIPALQREIRLLQQLGEKLEATLRANNLHPATMYRCPETSQSDYYSDYQTVFYTPRSTLNIFGNEPLPIVHLGWRLIEQMEHIKMRAKVIAPLYCFGFIREFRMETKTLTELKTADETQCFYLPLAEDGGLERTSFRKLRENPSVLLQQLRPLTPARPFNLLEQDAMFFNSMLSYSDVQLISNNNNNNSNFSLDPIMPRESGGENNSTFALTAPYTRLSVRPQSVKETVETWTPEDVERMLAATVSATVPCEIPPSEPQLTKKSSRSTFNKNRKSLYGKSPKIKCPVVPQAKIEKMPQRMSNGRQVAPLKPLTEELEPRVQTQLLKTVLVGIVQVAVFLVLIMAFTYPDIRC